jgi:hypothetical protein
MVISDLGIYLTSEFNLQQTIYVVNKHNKQLIKCRLENIDIHTYTGMNGKPII